MARCEVMFVGSVPLPDAASVFETLGRRYGRAVRRLPDGETNDRLAWVAWQERVFAGHPQIEPVEAEADWRIAQRNVPTYAVANRPHTTQYRPRPGVTAETLRFGSLGYADEALASYEQFARLKHEGVVPAACRFMVAVPSPYNVISWCIDPSARALVETAYERALIDELNDLARRIPNGELSIQWDCAHDMQAFEGARVPWFEPAREGIIERLARIGDAIPAPVELGYHFCYGSYGGRHFVEPASAQAMVDLANGIAAQIRRSVAWIHMPVPADRSDDAFFAPLAGLRLPASTQIFLGLIHDTDGVTGTERRITAAGKYLADFGVATECGFGRRDPATLGALLDVHDGVLRTVCRCR